VYARARAGGSVGGKRGGGRRVVRVAAQSTARGASACWMRSEEESESRWSRDAPAVAESRPCTTRWAVAAPGTSPSAAESRASTARRPTGWYILGVLDRRVRSKMKRAKTGTGKKKNEACRREVVVVGRFIVRWIQKRGAL
jgi:hypothetical protein